LKDKGEIDTGALEHRGFLDLLQAASTETADSESSQILKFLRDQWALGSDVSESGEEDERLAAFRKRVQTEVKPKDLVALRAGGHVFPFEKPEIGAFWAIYLERTYSEGIGCCSICGSERAILRILPWQISVFGYSCPISSFNNTSFNSFGKTQTANSPMCFRCAARTSQVLQHLVQDPRHRAVLAKDESKGEGKTPLRNQLAVFWLNQEVSSEADGAGPVIDLEAILAKPFEADDDWVRPPAEVGQMKSLLNVPWKGERAALSLAESRFYLAVLSPNKSRLVVREWMDESVKTVVENMATFVDALSIIDSNGGEVVCPAIPKVLDALKPWKSRNAGIDSNLTRGLLRSAYRGLSPPPGLLHLAVQRFRVPDRPADAKEEMELAVRRTVLAAAMKLVLTYGQQEANTLQVLNMAGRSRAYLSGLLLATLEEAQKRAAGKFKLNTTIVDRYYGAASTAPGTVLGQLLNQSTKSHMPKVRREGRGYNALEELLEDAMGSLDQLGGFPNTLTLREQAEFALGFYHQRAAFGADRREIRISNAAQQQGEIEK